MSPHKLLIEVKVEALGELKQYLKTYDVIRGEPFHFEVKITNIGDRPFPGGSLKEGSIRGGTEIIELNKILEKVSIKYLELNETVSFLRDYLLFQEEGIKWLIISIEAKDNQPVEYYRHREEKPRNLFNFPIYVVNREDLQIIHLLQSLIRKLERG